MSQTASAGRAAQVLLGIPLGLFQLAAVIGFSVTARTITGADLLIGASGIAMSSSCAVLALYVYRSPRARSIAFVLLGAQACFSFVKLVFYHEWASLVFLGIITLTAAALFIYHRGRGVDAPVPA